MAEGIFLKPIEERSRCVDYIPLLDDYHTLEIWMHKTWLHRGANSNICIESLSMGGVFNVSETLVEEVIEALMNSISLDE